MRLIDVNNVVEPLKDAIIKSCLTSTEETIIKINQSINKEISPIAKDVLSKIIENNDLAKINNIPTCQDTGILVIFLEIGYDIHFIGDIYETINDVVKKAYIEGYLRKSVVNCPIRRINTNDNSPAIIHTELVKGDKVKITVMPKGAGSENVSVVKMLTPSAGVEGIKNTVLETINLAGGKPCPPIIVSIGIGGDLEKCAIMAKKGLIRDLNDVNPNAIERDLENQIFTLLNNTGIGPMGLGGHTTVLRVFVSTYPCHIASLPLAINIQCHANRHITLIL